VVHIYRETSESSQEYANTWHWESRQRYKGIVTGESSLRYSILLKKHYGAQAGI